MGPDVGQLRYVPEGGGAYHWITDTDDTRRWFVTCDDSDTKPWLGSDPNTAFDGLLVAYRAAMDLRASGLAFVMAPVGTVSGQRPSESTIATASRCSSTSRVQRPLGPTADTDVVGDVNPLLAELHQSTPVAHHLARRRLDVPGRHDLERACADRPDHPCRSPAVVTHGESHPGNFIRCDTGLALIDWDTIALARRNATFG